jgi:hypothetical protein
MKKRVYPVPEIILRDRVTIEATEDSHSGSMDNEKRIMRVPLIDSPACRHVRAHEMAHAKYSPEKPKAPKGIHLMTLQRCEDMRMNVLCRAQGLNQAMDAPMVTDSAIWDRLLPMTDPRACLTAGVSTYDTGDWIEFSNSSHTQVAFEAMGNPKTDAEIEEFIAGLYSALKDNPTFAQTIKNALAVEKFLDPDSEDSEEGDESEEGELEGGESGESEKGESGDSDSDDSDSGSAGDGESDSDEFVEYSLDGSDPMDRAVDRLLEAEALKESMTPYEKGVETFERCKSAYSSEGNAKIVPAKVTVQKMPKRLAPSKFKSRQKVPADRGMVPKHMNRYCTDQAIFAGRGRKRSRGGTIVIDASGSMSINESQIDAIMDRCPLGTIASYSGDRAWEGDLYVIAQKGKRAIDNLRPPGKMNLVDVPALEWMVKQDGPYYWVCDGCVSGANSRISSEFFGRNVFERCQELVEQHGIIMVPNLDALVEVIEGEK